MKRLYLILFSGGMNETYNHPRYKNDITLALNAFAALNNFSPSRTIVLLGPGGDTIPLGNASVTATSGTRENLKAAVEQVASEATQEDLVIFLASNHGGFTVKGTRNAKLYCWNEDSVADSEFTSWFDKVTALRQVFIFGQCKSGGFIDNLEAPHRIIIAAARWDQNSWATQDLQYDEFLFHFINAVAQKNGTLRGCYDYAVQKDERPEEPQISDLGEIGNREDVLLFAD